jgi:hypothetical protein
MGNRSCMPPSGPIADVEKCLATEAHTKTLADGTLVALGPSKRSCYHSGHPFARSGVFDEVENPS